MIRITFANLVGQNATFEMRKGTALLTNDISHNAAHAFLIAYPWPSMWMVKVAYHASPTPHVYFFVQQLARTSGEWTEGVAAEVQAGAVGV